MKYPLLFAFCAAVLLGGCATTTDPSQGGLFSYSPDAYEKRKAERQTRLAELQGEQRAEERRQGSLNKELKGKRQERAAVQRKIDDAQNQAAGLQLELNAYQAKNARQTEALADLKSRQARLAKDLDAADGNSMNAEAKAAEAERLRREVERLVNETAALSAL